MSLSDIKTKLAKIAVIDAASSLPMVAETSHDAKGSDLDATVLSSAICDAARILDECGLAIEAVTGVDWLAEGQMEVVYDFISFETGKRVTLRTRVQRDKPELHTISAIYPGANWHERETHDFFGIVFLAHPNLLPFILPEDADFHPLRKDYKP